MLSTIKHAGMFYHRITTANRVGSKLDRSESGKDARQAHASASQGEALEWLYIDQIPNYYVVQNVKVYS